MLNIKGLRKKIYMFPGRVYVTYSGILGLPLWNVYSTSLVEIQTIHSFVCSLNINVSNIIKNGKNYCFSIDTNIYYGMQLYYMILTYINNYNVNADLIMDFSTNNIIRIISESNLCLTQPQLMSVAKSLMYEVKTLFEKNNMLKKLKIDTDYLANTQLLSRTYLDGYLIIREFELINKNLRFK